MSDIQAQFSVLRQTADPAVADAIAHLIEKRRGSPASTGSNVLDFLQTNRARRGAADFPASSMRHDSACFDLTWNVLCPGCGGVLDAHATLKALRHDDYNCALCAAGYEASVDEQVEVAFTVSPRVRHIAGTTPYAADLGNISNRFFWSSGSIFQTRSRLRR